MISKVSANIMKSIVSIAARSGTQRALAMGKKTPTTQGSQRKDMWVASYLISVLIYTNKRN